MNGPIFNLDALRAGDIVCGRGTAAISRMIMLRTSGPLSLIRGDSWSHDSGVIEHNGKKYFGDSHMGCPSEMVDPWSWEKKCLAGEYRVLVIRPTGSTPEQGQAAAWYWQTTVQGTEYDSPGIRHLSYRFAAELLGNRVGHEDKFWCTEGWRDSWMLGACLDPWAPKLNPTPGTTRRRLQQGRFEIVAGALTEFGQRYAINFAPPCNTAAGTASRPPSSPRR